MQEVWRARRFSTAVGGAEEAHSHEAACLEPSHRNAMPRGPVSKAESTTGQGCAAFGLIGLRHSGVDLYLELYERLSVLRSSKGRPLSSLR